MFRHRSHRKFHNTSRNEWREKMKNCFFVAYRVNERHPWQSKRNFNGIPKKCFLNVLKEICQGWFNAFVIIHLKENNDKKCQIKT